MISAATFKGYHYFGVADWTGNTGARIWRTDGTLLSEVVGDGFGDPENRAPGGLAAFGNWIYVSVYNPDSYEVWRSSSGNPGSWSLAFEFDQGVDGSRSFEAKFKYYKIWISDLLEPIRDVRADPLQSQSLDSRH